MSEKMVLMPIETQEIIAVLSISAKRAASMLVARETGYQSWIALKNQIYLMKMMSIVAGGAGN